MAYGACVQAAVLERKSGAPSMYVRNVTPLTIGIINSNKEFQCPPLLKRNTSYPIEKKIFGRTQRDNQLNAKIILFEGEQSTMKGNNILGSMIVKGLMASPKGNEIVEISVKIDEKGSISATAIDRNTKNRSEIKIERPRQFSEHEITQMTNSVAQLRRVVELNVLKTDLQMKSMQPMNKRMKIEKDEKVVRDEICPVYGCRELCEIREIELDD